MIFIVALNAESFEFFLADAVEEGLPQKMCPKCGKMHDFDYPKCPFCKYDYTRKVGI